MNCEFKIRRSTQPSFRARRRALWTTAWQTTLLFASGLTAITWSRLPALAAPQDASVSQDAAQDAAPAAAQEVPCMLPQDAEGVVVLFSGKAEELTQNFIHPDGTAPTWTLTSDSSLLAQTADLMTKQEFDDFQLHVEFKLPANSGEAGKARNRSGIILHGRFQMQIRDSFGISHPGVNDSGAVYNAHAPLANPSKAPDEWQSYDIIFRAPRFSEDGKTRLQAASVTAFLNGVLVQNNTEISRPTEGYKIGEASKPAPILLQYHGAAVEFRSIWILPMSRKPVAAPHTPAILAWQDAQQGDQIKVSKVTFDEGGYQVVCDNGDTIAVPFANDNTDVMKFGRSDTDCAYFVNDGTTPVLYLDKTLSLSSAVVDNAQWYPLTADYAYSTPVYVDLAPTWNGFSGMGWYPGMTIYGGVVGGSGNGSVNWMPGYYTSIDGTRFASYAAYIAYLSSHPGYVRNRVIYVNYPTPVVGGSGGMSGSKGSPVRSGTRPLPSARPVPRRGRTISPPTTMPISPGGGTHLPVKTIGPGGSGGRSGQRPGGGNRTYNGRRNASSGRPNNIPPPVVNTPARRNTRPAPPRPAAPRPAAPPRRNAPKGRRGR